MERIMKLISYCSSNHQLPPRRRFLPVVLALLGCLSASSLRADERLFTYSYQADSILPKGGVEFEQWITHKNGKDDGVFARWDLREEIEYGLTERLTSALYLNLRNTHSDGVPGLADADKFEFKGISSEWKYQILNPNTKPVGLLLYGEATYDGEEFELEEKLIVSKNFGEKWTVAFNAILEEAWEFEADATEEKLELGLTAGVSYRLTPHWAFGLEAMNVREFDGLGFNSQENNAYFVGPNLHYGTGRWWATLTVMPQVAGRPETRSGLNLKDHERVQVRLIAGYNF